MKEQLTPKEEDEECEIEKQELSQISPNELTEEQQHKILEYCRADPMFFYRYVAQFNIEKTSLLEFLQQRLVTSKPQITFGSALMMREMRTLHDRKLPSQHIDINALTGDEE